MRSNEPKVFGILAEFEQPDDLLQAIRAARSAGYRHLDAYSPFPLAGLSEAIGMTSDRVPFFTLVGGLAGGIGGYLMQWYSNVVDFPINVGGRPFHSWPAFIPITFELTILGAALSAVVSMVVLNGLPQPYHPVFTQDNFARASKDRFFLCIESSDPLFESFRLVELLAGLGALSVAMVPHES